MKALGETDARRVLAAGEAWRPWRAYAVMHLWQSLHKGMTMHYYDLYESPHGQMLLVASDDGLAGVYFEGQKYLPQDRCRNGGAMRDTHALRQAKRELAEYFAGRAQALRDRARARGTPFQHAVWKAISTVGFGETITYGELARRAGAPGSARAAGAATGRNPHHDHRSLPPHRRLERQPDRLCGRPGAQARAARAGVGGDRAARRGLTRLLRALVDHALRLADRALDRARRNDLHVGADADVAT